MIGVAMRGGPQAGQAHLLEALAGGRAFVVVAVLPGLGGVFVRVGQPGAQRQLTWLYEYLGMSVKKGDSLFEILEGLMRRLLPSISEEDFLNIMAKRMVQPAVWDEVLALEENSDLVDEQDQKHASQVVQQVKSQKEQSHTFKRTWVVRRTTRQSASGSRQKPSKPVAFKACSGAKIAPMPFPTSGVTLALAIRCVPDLVRLYEDSVNHRWQVYWAGVGSRSRSWLLHCYLPALRQVLQWSWAEVLSRKGLPLSQCPIRNLFDGESGHTAAPPKQVSAASASA